MALFTDYTILKQHCESRHPLIYDRVVFDPRAEAIMFERPSTLLLSKLTGVTNFLPSLVASWVAYFTGVAVYAMSMLAEVFRGAYFTEFLSTSVVALLRLTFQPTWSTPLASVAMSIDIVLIDGTATLADTTNKQVFTFSIVSGHYGVIRVDYIATTSFL